MIDQTQQKCLICCILLSRDTALVAKQKLKSNINDIAKMEGKLLQGTLLSWVTGIVWSVPGLLCFNSIIRCPSSSSSSKCSLSTGGVSEVWDSAILVVQICFSNSESCRHHLNEQFRQVESIFGRKQFSVFDSVVVNRTHKQIHDKVIYLVTRVISLNGIRATSLNNRKFHPINHRSQNLLKSSPTTRGAYITAVIFVERKFMHTGLL